MPLLDALTFHTSEVSEHDMYKLMIGSVVPRPIAWVSSMSRDGVLNLAPFSFFTVASRNPPTLLISIGLGVEAREGTVKDTLTNIREVREYVINTVSVPLADTMHRLNLLELLHAPVRAGKSPQCSKPRSPLSLRWIESFQWERIISSWG
ncbi:flavin reductase family protein [Brevibacillus sp. NRS-1366]|uniref:flavin reductase family protein n=1 Tax=Brevibacillus sp. NRS-1366 TaxID=3233899 RepID=UPI003D1F67D6